MKKGNLRKTFINIIVLIVLLTLIFFVFRKDYKEIISCIKNISLLGFLILLGMEIIYLLFDTAACYLLIRSQFPFFKFRQALCVTFLGIFGNAAAFSAGIIPLQSYYLYKCNIEVGNTVGLMNLKYVFHKSTIFIYAAILMIMTGNQISADIPNLMKYIYTGFTLCAIIIIFLILICTLRSVQQLLLYLTEKLPNTEKWMHRKSVWNSNLKSLYDESKSILGNKSCCAEIMLINLLKFFCFYSIPFMCVKILGFSGLTFAKAQAISSGMLLIMGVLPNIAGIGPAEFTFMLLFSAFLGKIETSSALILYRVVTYFFPFLLSILIFLHIKNNIMNETNDVKTAK